MKIFLLILSALAVIAGPHAALGLARAVLITAIAVTIAATAVLMLLIIRRILGDLPAAARPAGGVT